MIPSRPGVRWASSDRVEGHVNNEGPDTLGLRRKRKTYDPGYDILKLRVKGDTHILLFKYCTISDGSVHIFDVRKSASGTLNTDPQRLSLSYKGRDLSDDRKSAKEYDLKHLSEVMCVVFDEFGQDAADGDLLDSERDRRSKKAVKEPFASFTPIPSKEPQQTYGFRSPGWLGTSRTATRGKPAGSDPNTPGGDEQMASRTSAYAGHAQTQDAEYYPDRLPSSKPPVRDSSTETHDSGYRESSSTRDASPLRSSARLSSDPEIGRKSELSSRYAMVGNEKTFVGESSRILGLGNPKPNGLFQKQLQRQHDGLTGETTSEEEKIVRELQATNDQSDVPSADDVVRQKVGDQLLPPEQPTRPRSAPVTDFHGIAAKAFEEDVFVWSSATRDLTPTMASVDTQSDRNLVYVAFLENDLRLEYKKYDEGGATPLRTLAGSVWPLGWVMLKIFPFKVNRNSGVKERHRPQHVVFDVYETATFGDMLLGNEYAEGHNICNFLIRGSRKTTAQTEALRRQREEEFRRFEAENASQTPNGQTNTTSNASTNNSGNATGQQR